MGHWPVSWQGARNEENDLCRSLLNSTNTGWPQENVEKQEIYLKRSKKKKMDWIVVRIPRLRMHQFEPDYSAELVVCLR